MGLKKGAGQSGIESGSSSPDRSSQALDSEPSTDQPTPSADPEPELKEDEKAPLLERRDSVKDERDLMQFFLRSEVYDENTENRLKADVGDQLGEAPYAFDLREAVIEVGKKHVDEVVDELREMGYE